MTTNKLKRSKTCVHHFMLPEPSGENKVIGVCKKCGAEQMHELVIPWKVWNSWRGDPKKNKKGEPMTPGARRLKQNENQRRHRQKGTDGTHTTARHD